MLKEGLQNAFKGLQRACRWPPKCFLGSPRAPTLPYLWTLMIPYGAPWVQTYQGLNLPPGTPHIKSS